MNTNYRKKIVRQNVNGRTKYTEVLLPYYLEKPITPVGPWGKRRLSFLQEYRQDLLDELLENDTLNDHLVDVDRQANGKRQRLVRLTRKSRPGTAQSKNTPFRHTFMPLIASMRKRIEESYA